MLGGHLDTVPANDNATPRIDGDTLHGLGSADMKGGARGAARARRARADGAAFDVTLVFYEARGGRRASSTGSRTLFRDRPELVAGDLAILLEPTGGWVEAGCQGTLHLRAEFDGARAHSARPWMGENAIHRAARVLSRARGPRGRRPSSVDGLAYRESLQVVRIEGGVANNVVPDACRDRGEPPVRARSTRSRRRREQTEALLAGADRDRAAQRVARPRRRTS